MAALAALEVNDSGVIIIGSSLSPLWWPTVGSC